MHTILVVEDNEFLQNFVVSRLERDGYNVISTAKGADAIKLLSQESVHLVILDLGLGDDISGVDVLTYLRERSVQTPVLITTSESELEKKISLFRKGCDDYLTKPFQVEELVARVERALIKYNIQMDNSKLAENESNYVFPDFEINTTNHSIIVKGEEVSIRRKLFRLLLLFVQNPETVYSKSQLYNMIWQDPSNSVSVDNTISVHIRHLREIIEPVPSTPQYLMTVRGVGYLFKTKK